VSGFASRSRTAAACRSASLIASKRRQSRRSDLGFFFIEPFEREEALARKAKIAEALERLKGAE
jgi:hypothetical protein